MVILEQVVNGLLLGASYSLIAIGFSIIFGVLLLFNMAHGEVLMASSFFAAYFLLYLKSGTYCLLTLALIISICVGAILSILVERVAFRPLRTANPLSPMLATLGIGIFLDDFLFYWTKNAGPFSAFITAFPNNLDFSGFNVGDIHIRTVYIVNFLIALILMILTHMIVKKSKTGRAMRALAENANAARLMGINLDKTIRLSFMVAGGLAGAAGFLLSMVSSAFDVTYGGPATLIGLVVMVLGGLGSITGAMIGGLVFGVLNTLTAYFLETSYQDVVTFGILFLVLIFRPSGLFGRAIERKV